MGILDDMYNEDWNPASLMAADDGGRALREAVDALRQRRAVFKAQLDRGVAPDEFRKGQALLESYDAAIAGLEQAWETGRNR